MLRLALMFAIISLLAGAFGFYGLSDASATVAKVFAMIFGVLFLLALVAGATAVRKVTD
jgi:uncharacterized membrane protein YtjA (UPF0391 family)